MKYTISHLCPVEGSGTPVFVISIGERIVKRRAACLALIKHPGVFIDEIVPFFVDSDGRMKCYLDEKTDIGHFVTSKIQTLAGVKDTFTLITFKAFS